MLDFYEVSVHKDGRHLFSTSTKSVTTSVELENALRLFRKKFPSFEGYIVDHVHWKVDDGAPSANNNRLTPVVCAIRVSPNRSLRECFPR